MRIFTSILLLYVCQCSFAATKTWNGGATGSWSNGANWSPVGVPAIATSPSTGDDIVFDGSITATVTITDYPAQVNTDYWGQLSLINNVTVNISSGSDTYMYFGTGLTINTGCRINIGAATTTIFDFGNKSAVVNSGLIYGTVELKGTGTNATTNRKHYSTAGRTRLFGKMIVTGTAAQLSSTVNWTNFYIESGGELEWARDGLSLSSLNCTSGGIINITGIVTAPLVLANAGTYAGLIIWNCPSQTAQKVSIVPQVYPFTFNVDSIRVINTGTGSATLGSQPSYSVGHVEVQGGTMYLGSPANASYGSSTILTDLKLTGGTLIGNATFTGDATAAYPLTIPVGRDLIITGGTFNLTNRPTGLSPAGAIQLNVARNVSQSGGSIFATSAFGSQNYINMNGTGAQTLELDNMTDLNLIITNTSATLGVTLADNVTISPSAAFTLTRGYLKLDNYTLTVPASRFFQNVFSPMPKIVTSGYGKLKLTGITASSTTVFPVAPFAVNSYDPVTITTTAGASTNNYSVRVQRGIASGAIYSTKVINRTWTINGTNTIVSNTVGLTYQYNDTAKQVACIPATAMEEGHFAGGVWNVDPPATLLTPTGSNPYIVGPFYPSSIDSSFAIGNLASILAINNPVQLSAQKNNNSAALKWTVSNTVSGNQFFIERSANGRTFMALSMADANNFNYTDNQLLSGLNYYRIKMIDIDGRCYYSNIVAILNAAKGTILLGITPNPVTGNILKMQVTSAVAVEMKTQITDVTGRNIDQQKVHLIAGSNVVELNAGALPSGSYIIYGIVAGERTRALHFVKQ
jgi:hypothetical protein